MRLVVAIVLRMPYDSICKKQPQLQGTGASNDEERLHQTSRTNQARTRARAIRL